MNKHKILFLSANRMGYEVLSECIKTIEAEYYVMTLSDESKVVMYDGIDSNLWSNLCKNVIKIKSIRSDNVKKTIIDLDLDLIIMCGWRQVVNSEIMSIPKLGTIGFHPTPLPKGRGSSPIINSILEGWKKSAVTLFFPDDGVDTGDIIDQAYFPITENDYAIDVYEKCINASKKLVNNNLASVLLNKPNIRRKQNDKKATYLKKITLSDNEIKREDSSIMIYRKIRAFSEPYLGAFINLGDRKLIIDKARLCTKIKKY